MSSMKPLRPRAVVPHYISSPVRCGGSWTNTKERVRAQRASPVSGTRSLHRVRECRTFRALNDRGDRSDPWCLTLTQRTLTEKR